MMRDMDEPFKLVSAIPRVEVPTRGLISDMGISNSTVLFFLKVDLILLM